LKAQQCRPSFTLEKVGLGAGMRDLPLPNMVRAILGHKAEKLADEVDVLTTNIDDSGGEALGYLLPLLMDAGALDACYTPLVMKKGRPAWQLQVISPPALTEHLQELILKESSTLGLRIRREHRRLAPRSTQTVNLPQGEVSIKISGSNIAPEYEDIARIAREQNASFQEAFMQAINICRNQL